MLVRFISAFTTSKEFLHLLYSVLLRFRCLTRLGLTHSSSPPGLCAPFNVAKLSCSCTLTDSLENSKVCSIIRKRELKLQEKENSAIVLKEFRYFDNWSGTHQFNCNFTVFAPWGYGIIAVIQNLDLRQNESTKECIDFVQVNYMQFLCYSSVHSIPSLTFCFSFRDERPLWYSLDQNVVVPTVAL